MSFIVAVSILGGRGTAPKGRNLNSLGFQPQVGDVKKSPSPEGAALNGAARYLGLKPQAIQIPPLQGGWGTGSESP